MSSLTILPLGPVPIIEDISNNCPGVGKGKIIKANRIKKDLKEDFENDKAILKKRVSHQK